RDRLAARLAGAKQRDRAREVKALRRPTVAAWAVNQLAHRHAGALRRLIQAGDVLRRAQRRVLRGATADELRAAAKDRQDALRELRRLAGPVLREAGGATHLDDVLATLEAASVDPVAAKVVTAGRLPRELPRPAGFGETSSLRLVATRESPPARPTREPKRRDADGTAERRPRRSDAGAERRRARERAAEAKRLARDAARRDGAAKRAADRSERLKRNRDAEDARVKALRAQLDAAERRLREAEADLARARTEEAHAAEQAAELRRMAEAARHQGPNAD